MESEEDIYYDKVLKLIGETEKSHTFVLNGSLFKGSIVHVAKEFVNSNSNKKFRIWLIDKGLLIDDSFDENYIEPKRNNNLI